MIRGVITVRSIILLSGGMKYSSTALFTTHNNIKNNLKHFEAVSFPLYSQVQGTGGLALP
jgi:hypothetical protein